jgi:hypothetical protein
MTMLAATLRRFALVSVVALLPAGVGCAAQVDDPSSSGDGAEDTGAAGEPLARCTTDCPGSLATIIAVYQCQGNCDAAARSCMVACAESVTGGSPACYGLCGATQNACYLSCQPE